MTIIDKFKETVAQHSDRVALGFLANGKYQTISYRELDLYRLQIAHFYKNSGFKKGETIAVMLPNSPEWVITDLAAATLGLIVVPIHTTFNAEYLKKVIEHSAIPCLLINQELFQKHQETIKTLNLKKIILVGSGVGESNTSRWPQLDKTQEVREIKETISPQEMHTIIYTSGTTSDPKGVMLSHKNIISDIESAKRHVLIKPEDRFFSFLPLSHAFERTAGYYCAIFTGASLYFARNSKTIVEDIKKAKPTIINSAPRIFEKIYSTIFDQIESGPVWKKKIFFQGLRLGVSKRKKELRWWQWLEWKTLDLLVLKKLRYILGGRLRLAISGGASLDIKIMKFFDNLGLQIIEGYGLTETSPIIAVNRVNDYCFGTVGKALDCNEIKILDNKEILVRGSNVMLGYYKNEQLTKETIDQDGWLKTGDLGFIDKEGFLTVIGRLKDMIVLSTGKKVFPEAIENALNDGRYINQSLIYGDKSKHISALIVPNFEQLSNWCKQHDLELDLNNEKIINFFKDKINENLVGFSAIEKINNFRLIKEEFSQENGLLSPTLKLRRSKIINEYKIS